MATFNEAIDKAMKDPNLPLIIQKDNFQLFLDEIIDIIYEKAEEHDIDGLKFAFNYKGNIQPFYIKSRKIKEKTPQTNGKTSRKKEEA